MFIEVSENVARAKPAFQSSSYGSANCYDASFAVDGNRTITNEYCEMAHTEREQNPWWAVDLGSATRVINVTITPRPGFGK